MNNQIAEISQHRRKLLRLRITNAFASAALSLTCASAIAANATPAHASNAFASKPDALLQIDMNRSAVIEKIVESWKKELPAAQVESFKQKLEGLRADHLLAANLSGSFDGVLEIVNRIETANQTAPQLQTVPLSADKAKALGDSAIDLVYTPIAPCRIFDTRSTSGPFVANGTNSGVTRFFDVDGTDLTAQGGSATGCNIAASARAVVLAISPISPPTTGWFVGADVGTTIPFASGTLFNYSSNLTLSTFTVVMPMLGGGGSDIQLQARGVSAYSVHAVGDVTGYFAPPVATPQQCQFWFTSTNLTAGSGYNSVTSPSCSAGYTPTSRSCYSGTNSANNYLQSSGQFGNTGSGGAGANAQLCEWWVGGSGFTGTASITCCRVPGR
jgi:hypothetical protein